MASRSRVWENSAGQLGGGGIYIDGGAPRLTNVIVADNRAAGDWGYAPPGGGIDVTGGAAPVLTNVVVVGNRAEGRGGGLCVDDGAPVLINVVVTSNRASTGAGIHGAAALSFGDVWGNTPDDFDGMTDPTGTDGNLPVDPQSTTLASTSTRSLRSSTPAIPLFSIRTPLPRISARSQKVTVNLRHLRRVKLSGLYPHLMSFPASSLRPRHAEISALVFENSSVGVPLGLYWSFRVEFEALTYSEYEFNCNLSADWAKIPRRDWRELAGCEIEGGNDVIDASFYTTGHDSATYTSIRIGGRQGTLFAFDWQSRIDFLGLIGDDADPDFLVHACTTAAFTGVLVYTPLLQRFPSPREGAEALLCQFIDRNAFGQLVNRSNEFGVEEWRLLPE